MRRPALALVSAAAAAALLAAGLPAPVPVPAQAPDGPSPDPPDHWLAQYARRAPHLDRVDTDLAAGRVSLAAAVRRFEAVRRRWPIPAEWVPRMPGNGHGERLAALLIERAADTFEEGDPRRDDLTCRLTAELVELTHTGELADVGSGDPGPGWTDPGDN